MRRRLAVVVFMACFLFGVPTGALADIDDDTTPGGGVTDGVPEAVVIRGPADEVIAETSTGGGGGTWTCRYFPFLPGEIGEQGPNPGAPIVPTPGQYVALMCFDQAGQTVYTEALYYEPSNPFGGIAAAERAMAQAREQLDPPDPTIAVSPPATSFQLVGVPSWFWVADPWEPLTASATLAGVTSTVIATPVDVSWDISDGTSFSCAGPGTAFDSTRPSREQSSDCTHTFDRSSRSAPGGTYTVTATVAYVVRWEATTGAGAPLDDVTRNAASPIRVEEAQAVTG